MNTTNPTSKPTMPGDRFSYVAYDEKAMNAQAEFKTKFTELEAAVQTYLQTGRATSLILTKLEEAYMWVGKAIRDDQIARNGSAPEQPGRTNS